MSSHFATADVRVGNLDDESEADAIAELIESALSAYQVTVTVTAHPYPETDGGETT